MESGCTRSDPLDPPPSSLARSRFVIHNLHDMFSFMF